MALTIHSVYGVLFQVWRRNRFALFLQVMEPKSTDLLIDVGGRPGFWLGEPQTVARIDAVNPENKSWDPSTAPAHNIRLVVGDGCALDATDGSYDIAFSNSVIEHVGSWENQQKFAAEIRRVGRAIWVQTPAWECPIEPHYLSPLVHYLPRWLRRRVVGWATPWGWLQRPNRTEIDFMVDTTRLLKKKEMRELFPDCELITERMLWFVPKSYIAVRRAEI